MSFPILLGYPHDIQTVEKRVAGFQNVAIVVNGIDTQNG